MSKNKPVVSIEIISDTSWPWWVVKIRSHQQIARMFAAEFLQNSRSLADHRCNDRQKLIFLKSISSKMSSFLHKAVRLKKESACLQCSECETKQERKQDSSRPVAPTRLSFNSSYAFRFQ